MIKFNTNKCKKCLRYIKLLFLLELIFFFGWGCYINLRSYYSQATENEVTDIIRERYVQNFEALESVAEMQKLHSTTEIPYSISMLSNNMEISDINNLLIRSSSEDLVHDKGIEKNLMPFDAQISSIEFIEDANRLTLNNQKDHALDTSNEIESLGVDVTTITNLKDSVDFKIKFGNGVQDVNQRFFDFIKDAEQNNYGEESSRDKIDEQVNTSLDSDLIICPPYQSYESSDVFSKQSIENSSTSQYHTSSASIPEFLEQIINILNDDGTKNKDKHNSDDSNILMSASSDASVSGSDEHFVLDTWLPIAIQNTQDHHSLEISANIKQQEEKHKLMENIAPLFNFEFLQPKIQDSKESSTSNDKFQWFNAPPVFANNLQLGLKDILESSKTQNPLLEDTLEDTKIISAFIPEKDKFHNQCEIQVEMNIFRIKCPEIMFDEQWNLASPPTHTTDSSNVINFKDIFDLDNTDNYYDYYDDKDENEHLKDLIFNENSDKKVASLQQSASVTDGVITSMPSLKDVFNSFFKINSFDRTEIDKQDGIHSSDQEKIREKISSSSTTIPSFTSVSDLDTIDFNTEQSQLQEVSDIQQLKVTEKQDFLNFQNAETFLKIDPHVNALEKELTSIFNDEMLNFIKQLQSNSFLRREASLSKDDYLNNPYICNIFPDFCSIPPNSGQLQHVNLKGLLEEILSDDNSYKDYNYRKKRMADGLTERYGILIITSEEDILTNLLI